jgi:alpha-amylase
MKGLKRIIATFSILIFIATTLVGCGSVAKDTKQKNYDGRAFYEIFVRSFNDTDGDGVGDLKGVTAKLDYLQDLGIKGIWLMPINESGTYHGYDVDDYYSIDKEYGSLEDLEELISEARIFDSCIKKFSFQALL